MYTVSYIAIMDPEYIDRLIKFDINILCNVFQIFKTSRNDILINFVSKLFPKSKG